MSILFAILTAFANALSVVTQHKASITAPKQSKGWNFVAYLCSEPVVALRVGGPCRSFPLPGPGPARRPDLGSTAPLVTELVFALSALGVGPSDHQGGRLWSAGLTCVALAVFIAAAEPSGGSSGPTSGAWVSAAAAMVGGVMLLALLGWQWQGSAARRAALFGPQPPCSGPSWPR